MFEAEAKILALRPPLGHFGLEDLTSLNTDLRCCRFTLLQPQIKELRLMFLTFIYQLLQRQTFSTFSAFLYFFTLHPLLYNIFASSTYSQPYC